MKFIKTSLLTTAAALAAITIANAEPKQGKGPRMDANGDGEVTFEEFSEAKGDKLDAEKLQAQFDKMDQDQSGTLSKEELQDAMKKGKGKGKHPKQNPDANGDGKVTLEEMAASRGLDAPSERMKKRFEKLDTNGDGALDESERPKPKDNKKPKKGPKGQQPDEVDSES